MKNKLTDLNNYLFEQLENLNDEDLDLDKEIKKAKAITDVSKCIIANANVILKATEHFEDINRWNMQKTPELFITDNKKDEI